MTTIPFLRTPEQAFSNIPDFPYKPQYLDNVIGGLRMAYYDIPSPTTSSSSSSHHHTTTTTNDNNANPPVFLCLHGEPSWSFLYRKMIPIFQQQGRVICIDLLGFGRSDKPTKRKDYTYGLHRTSLLIAIHQRLNLHNITLVVQDWGGVLGLTLPMEAPYRYSRLIVMNTGLPMEPESFQTFFEIQRQNQQGSSAATGGGGNKKMSGFAQWLHFSQTTDDLDIGGLLQLTCEGSLSEQEVAAYNAPFPTKDYKMGAIVFPTLVPFSRDMEGYDVGRRALFFYQYVWKKPTFMAVGARDKVIPIKAMRRLHSYFDPHCINQELYIVQDGGHFVQEKGDSIAKHTLEYFAKVESTPLRTTISRL